MHKNLVIVESPAKAKTIEKFLGKDYKVLSSYGHIRDLKKKDFSIDIENNYTPIYEIPADKKKLVETLKEEAGKADMVWLGSGGGRGGVGAGRGSRKGFRSFPPHRRTHIMRSRPPSRKLCRIKRHANRRDGITHCFIFRS